MLTSDEAILIIPKGGKFNAIWDNELKEFQASDDMAVIHRGYLLKLQKEANEQALK